MTAITTRRDLTAAELRAEASRTKDSRAARRMLALALVLDGADRTSAAKTCGMDRQTLRDWVHRYTPRGSPGSRTGGRRRGRGSSRPSRWRSSRLGSRPGPIPIRTGVVRWRRHDLQRRIVGAFGVAVHERTVGKYLAALGYRRLSMRPRHPKADPAAQTALKKVFRRR